MTALDLIKCLKQIKYQRILLTFELTMCSRSSDPFYILAYYMKRVTTSWTQYF